MTEICPVNERQINENVTRLNALATFLVTGIFAVTPAKWIILFLPVDFALRAWFRGRFSPVGQMNSYLVSSFGIGEVLINAGPKVFAARIGLVLSGLIGGSYFIGFPILSLTLAGILLLFSFLEAAFGFCMACKVYAIFCRQK